MPTLYAQKTTVQLSVADLGRTATANPRTQQSLASSESIRNVAQEFAKGSKNGTLTETPFYTEDGSHVRFLGKHGNMPFFLVHAGKNFFDLTTKEKRNRRPARVPLTETVEKESASTAVGFVGEKMYSAHPSPPNIEADPRYKPPFKPHALCLTVFLSSSSFVRTKDRATTRTEVNDVKIDVYFNGTLCGSHYVPRRYAGEAHTMTEHIVRFTGRRIGRLIEKPWVIVPSGQKPDGGLREYRRGKVAYAGALERWNDISDALQAEADKIGHNERGGRPVIGEYLESLAQLSMPMEVEDMQKAGSPKFGIVDVVVIWGKGNKNGPDAPYILEPTPIRNEDCTITGLDQPTDYTSIQNIPETADSPGIAPRLRPKATVNAKSINHHSHNLPPLLTPSPMTTSGTNRSPSAASSSNKRPHPALPFETPVKRAYGHYYDILTTRQTLSEEINSIATAAVVDSEAGYNPTLSAKARSTRASYASTAGSSPLSSAPATRDHTPAQTKIVKFKLPSPEDASRSPGMTKTPRMQDREADREFLIRLRAHSPAFGSTRRERGPTKMGAEALDREFVTPALSADCGITYAAGGIVRNVGAARGGVFREGGVVMGARFVVGG